MDVLGMQGLLDFSRIEKKKQKMEVGANCGGGTVQT